jgi:hypothetical protein
LLLVAAIACTTTQARRAHRAGELATGIGLVGILGSVSAAALVPAHEDTLTTVGIAFVPVAVLGALLYISTDRAATSHEHARPLTRRERRLGAAWDLTKRAATAARSQDCTQVQAIDPRVRDLDADFHATVFLRDVAIERCMREP